MQLRGNLHFDLFIGLALRGAGAVSSFALVWMIARIFGAETVGLYQLALTTVTLAALPVGAGLDSLLVREIGPMLRHNRLAEARSFFVKSRRQILIYGTGMLLLLLALAFPLGEFALGQPRVVSFMLVLAPLVLFMPLLRQGNSFLRVKGNVLLSQTLEGVSYTTIAMLALAVAWYLGTGVDPLLPAIAYLAGCGLSLCVCFWVVGRIIRQWPAGGNFEIDRWSGFRMVAVRIVMEGGNWITLLLITGLLTIAETGVYRTAFQFCMLFQLVNASFAVMAGPHLSRASAAGEYSKIRRLTWSVGLIGVGICMPLAIIGLWAPEWLLGLFGEEFKQGALALQILLVSQLVNVAVGPVGMAQTMMKRELAVLKIEAVATTVGVIAAFVLLELYGLTGAALGALIASLIRNVGNSVSLRRLLREKEAEALAG